MMQHVELTVVVTAHSEGRLIRPTLRSVDAAIHTVVASGDRVELLLVCDNADERTSALATDHARETSSYPVRILTVALGESGAARNAGAAEARGEFVTYVDGDDLVSTNYFQSSLEFLRSESEDVIAHPEYVLSFGARSLLWKTDSTARDGINYRDLVRHNLWPSSSMARRSLYLAHPYRSLPPESGFGPEDWIWNIDTAARGIRHEYATDTVFFYRIKEFGGVNDRHRSSILPRFDFEALRRALPVQPTEPTPPQTRAQRVRRGAQAAYSAALPFVRRSTSWLSWEAKNRLYRVGRWGYRTVTGSRATDVGHGTPPAVLQAMTQASEIEPAISWTAFHYEDLPIWRARDDGFTVVLEAILDDIGDRGRALILAPWVGVGGADTVTLNYAKALGETDRFRDSTAILGTFLPERTVHETIPGTVHYAHIWNRWLDFPERLRRRLLAQAILLLDPDVVISVNSFHFTEAMRSYGTQIAGATRTYATLFAFDRIGAGYPTNPITDDGQRDYLDVMTGLLTDNSHTGRLIEDILALPRERILVQPQPVSATTPPLPRGTRAYNNVHFSTRNPFRLVWPHRLDEEKRPDVLIAVAQELRRRRVPAKIDVWGQFVLNSSRDDLLAGFEEAGIDYRGPYTGGLPSLATYDYHALLLTSQSEGMPLVLVQSLLLGLPVVASDIGGIGDLIVHGDTGLLAGGPDDIAGFADAVELLVGSRDLRRRLIEDGYVAAARRHSWEAFDRLTASTFL